jgi:hypothetical protein
MNKKNILASEFFSASRNRHYFADLIRAKNNSRYIQLTRSDKQEDGSYKRSSLIVFENNFSELISLFTSLFQAAAYSERGYQTIEDIARENKMAGGIKAMPEDARPREKLLAHGSESLRDEELLAILLGSGTPGESAVELGGRMVSDLGGNIRLLKDCVFSWLCSYKGMGFAKASAILAAIELGRRIYCPAQPEFKPVYLIRRPWDDGDDLPFVRNN